MKKKTDEYSADNFTVDDKKEKKKKKVEVDNKIAVIAFSGDGNSFRYLADFEAERYTENGTVYVKNDEMKFLIPYPETTENVTQLEIGKLASKLADLEVEIQDEIEEDTEEVKEKDLIDEYVKIKNRLRKSLYSSTSTFWGAKKEKPLVLVMRKGSAWYPLKMDSDTSTIHTISNPRNTITRTLESNKRTKYGALSNLTAIGLIFIVCSFLMVASSGYMWYKAIEASNVAYEKLDETELGSLIRECRVNLDQEKEVIKQSIIEGVSDSLVEKQTANDPVGSGR